MENIKKLRLEEHWMNLALKEAQQAMEEDEVPVGAVVIRDGLLLGKGHNQTRALRDPTAHSEILAITAACQTSGEEYLTGADLFVTLEPCAMCAGAIVLARISRLFFSAWDPKTGACGSVFDIVREPRLNHNVEVYSGIYAVGSQKLMDEFFAKLRTEDENI